MFVLKQKFVLHSQNSTLESHKTNKSFVYAPKLLISHTNMTSHSFNSAYAAYSRYKSFLEISCQNKNAINVLNSILIRRLIPQIGGPAPIGKRTTPEEQEAGFNFLKTAPAHIFENGDNLLEQAFTEEEKGSLRRARHVIKKFIQQLEVWGYFKPELETIPKEPCFNRFHNPPGQAKKDWHNESGRHHLNRYDRKKKKPYALMAQKAVTRKDYRKTSLIYPEDFINPQLMEDLRGLESDRKKGAKRAVKPQMQKVMQILGWLHREKGVPLTELRLTHIVSHSELTTNLSELLPEGTDIYQVDEHQIDSSIQHRIIIRKMLLEERAKQSAKNDILKIQEYISWLDLVPISSASYIDVIVAVAKYVYRQEIGSPRYPRPDYIPILQELYDLKRYYTGLDKITPESIPFEIKSLPWEDCIEVVEKLRQRYEIGRLEYRSKRCKRGAATRARTPHARATDLQKFLIFAFFIFIPPDRSRTLYELSLGKTLEYGYFEGRSFTKASNLKDQSLARWYIHLEMQDYKTGKRYGFYWAPVPNPTFPNGKSLYQYIDEWLSWGRECDGSISHNYFFRGIEDLAPLDHSDLCGYVTSTFERETDVAVAPKELRKMFVSYLKSKKATRDELEAARLAQHHSQKMQDSVYDYQDQLDKLQPIYDFNERVFQEVYQKLDQQPKKQLDNNLDEKEKLDNYRRLLEERQVEFDANYFAIDNYLKYESSSSVTKILT